MFLEVTIPRRASTCAIQALRDRFPYRQGDAFTYALQPTSDLHLAIIQLGDDPSDEQIEFLEAGRRAGMIAQYNLVPVLANECP